MPVDHKRVNAPENTLPYTLFSTSIRKTLKEQFEDTVSSNGVRADGRRAHEQRKIFLKVGVGTEAKGSAYIEVNDTKVIVSVFDPREIPNRNEYSAKGEIYCEFKYATFSCPKRRLHQQDSDEKEASAIMKKALESVVCSHEFPNFQVDIYALVLENNGSALSAAITAAGVALAHAGIPMYDIITSATVAVQGNQILVDPTLLEEQFSSVSIVKDEGDNHGIAVMSALATHEQVSQFYQTGNLDLEFVNKSIEALTKTCQEIVPLVQKCLTQFVIKNIRKAVNED